jgi:Ca2+-binding EF-hand superfamily protein
MENLTCKKIKEYRELFELFDRNKDGCLSNQELQEVKNYLINDNHGTQFFLKEKINKFDSLFKSNGENGGTNISISINLKNLKKAQELEDMDEINFFENDIDGNEKIDFEEFVILMNKKYKNTSTIRKELKSAFSAFDIGGDKISKIEIIDLMIAVDCKISQERILEILDDFNQEKNNYDDEENINFVDFIEYVLNQ